MGAQATATAAVPGTEHSCKRAGRVHNLLGAVCSYLARCRTPSALAFRETLRDKWTLVLAVFSIAVSCMVTALLLSVSNLSPYLFYATAVQSSGEIDLAMNFDVSVPWHLVGGSGSANDSMMKQGLFAARFPTLAACGDLCAPRLAAVPVTLYSAKGCLYSDLERPLGFAECEALDAYPYTGACSKDGTDIVPACQFRRNCLDKLCPLSAISRPGTLYAIDSVSERNAAISRRWNLRMEEIPPGGIVISAKLAASAGLKAGSQIFAKINFHDVIRGVDANSFGFSSYAYQDLVLPLQVHEILSNALGKISDDEGLWAFVELKHLYSPSKMNMHPDIPSQEKMKFFDGDIVLNGIICSICADRPRPYALSGFGSIAEGVLDWATSLALRLVPQIKPLANSTNDELANLMSLSQLPILDKLKTLTQFSSFVSLLLSLITLLLAALSVFFIHCLISVSVESRLYDFSVFRMVGMPQFEICVRVYAQAFFYVVPGVAIGLVLAQIAFVVFKIYFEEMLDIPISPLLSTDAIAVSCLLAIVVPLLSAALPIQRVLGFSLRDVFEGSGSRPSQDDAQTKAASDKHPDLMMAVSGAVIVVFGTVIYYVLPFALVTENTPVLFNIFLLILLSMLSAMIVLSQNIVPGLQRLMALVMFSALQMIESRVLYRLTATNILVHNERTSKTSILYALSLAVIICLSVSADMQINALQLMERRSMGADIVVSSDTYLVSGFPYPIANVRELERYASTSPFIRTFAWSTYSLKSTHPNISRTAISNIGSLIESEHDVFAVTPSFFDLCDPKFLQTDYFDSSLSDLAPGEQLYSTVANGSGSVVGSLYGEYFALDANPKQPTSEKYNLRLERKDGSLSVVRLSPVFLAHSVPFFDISSRQPASNVVSDVIISVSQFLELTRQLYSSVLNVPINKFFISLVPEISDADYTLVLNSITQLTSFETVTNIRSKLKGSRTAEESLSLIFLTATSLILVILYFSLSTSMQVAIMEQRREIAIMRALGLSRFAVYRLYFYEALLLLLSSATVGISIGSTVGWTMTAQQSLITNLPVYSAFPWTLLLVVVLFSILSAIVSVFFPVRNIVTCSSLVNVLKE